jgi:hypothetical protein
MKLRTAVWAGAGALVVVFWTLYISAAAPAARGTLWTLAYLTCSTGLARHYGLNFYVVLLANAASMRWSAQLWKRCEGTSNTLAWP